jgi:hypothetical protein
VEISKKWRTRAQKLLSQLTASASGAWGATLVETRETNLEGPSALCGHVIDPTNRLDYHEEAVQDAFWDESGADLALEFCDVLIDPKERERCYTTIIARAPQIIQNSEDLVEFCNRVAPEFRPYCMAGAR